MNKFAAVLGALALAGIGGSAQAQLATGTIVFLQPDGVVGPNEVIPVNVRLTLAQDSTTLTVGDFGEVLSGGPSDTELESQGFGPGVDFLMRFSPTAGCSGTFFPTNSCTPGDYSFDYKSPYLANFTLAAGDSIDFVIAEFSPKVGGAAPGTYNFYTAGFLINVFTPSFSRFSSFNIATTCFTGDDSCDFSRTVQPRGGPGSIPEPGTWALMIGGFGLAGAALRRRRAAVTA